ncbi:MAG: sensor domain-containing diguanylate cyclase [Desulfobacterota bacterium]|nr:sensor domain-containing diguanylate cyclase [Thermodesulfobacteriota bacterium]
MKGTTKNDASEIHPLDEQALEDFSRLNNELVNLQRELARTNAELARQKEWFRVTLESIGDAVIATDQQGKILLLNRVAEQLTGWKSGDAAGKDLHDVFVISNRQTGMSHPDLLESVLVRGETCILEDDTVLRSRDGRVIPIDVSGAPIRDASGKIIGCVFVFRDVTRRKEMEERLRELALRDGLTNLYNHREFFRLCREECERAQRYGFPLALLMLDIDFFKRVNDTFGHPAGDEVLRYVAATLTLNIRSSDRAARYGGEEFAVIMPQSGAAEATVAAERIRQAIACRPVVFEDGKTLSVTVSIGVAAYPEHGRKEHELVQSADAALYRAKQGGRNRVCTASEAKGEEMVPRPDGRG